MKQLLLLFFSFILMLNSLGQQQTYWQQKVDADIRVTLDDEAHSLRGDISMTYQNNSPDTLRFIWIHLWPNAYKNDRTALSDQLLQNGRTDFYFSNEAQRGYINRLDFKVNEVTAATEDHPEHQDITKVILPSALAPGGKISLATPFHVKLPGNFSRSGHVDQSYMVTQWYPKPAVYDQDGWHPMPYLDQGEFYSEFGNYRVSITLPKDYVVAATGKIGNADPARSEEDKVSPADSSISREGYKTVTYVQDDVHDFAWFADKEFEVLRDTLQLGPKTIEVAAYYNKANAKDWVNSLEYIKSAIRTKSEWIGEYPYPVVTVVEKAGKADGGGMEYPTITLISKTENEKMLDFLINHEVGHNWFYGILASNERKHPWLDEGMNSYYDRRYSMQQYGTTMPDLLDVKAPFLKNRQPKDIQETLLQTITGIKKDQPINTNSERFSLLNYGLIAYQKTAQWMEVLERTLGRSMFDAVMQRYFEQFRFKHPSPGDFKTIAQTVSGRNLDSIFQLQDRKGNLQKMDKKGVKFSSFVSLKETDKYNYLFIMPAAGFNYYDKLMLGATLHNYTLPLNKLRFFVAPMYAFGSKQLNGIGRISYSVFPGNKGQQLVLSVAGARFTGDSFRDSTGTNNYQPFSKIVPSVKFVFANKNARSNATAYIQWKTYLISETALLFQRDTSLQVDIISYPKVKRTVNEFQFVLENHRVLYPYKLTLQGTQGDGFVRTDLTANYFFNYATGGGMNVRFFAGKFFYTGNKTFLTQFRTDPYHLTMTGPKGYEDYTYSNYFYGRNEFEGLANQQIMIRDGAFKVRTDLLSDKVGKTDDWLSAINLTTTIPPNVNPLSVLPFKLPLKLFADIGTYAEAWEKDAGTPRFVYDAGLQLSFFKNTVNIYMPILYSKVYSDYFKSTIPDKRFLKNISFSIDIQNVSLKKLIPQIPF